ncbi:hypothetical protein M440DRAFT_1464831 [Trichoderma longibrachiatum ATCC 18648]|uniref:Uncharacterized protein n=1 Tax=Trichoderma longibrachiatum ATCC 18648 TaxID=983965 RepID=A0A2T4BVL2_TRILO|nr:hypothetical protein M440DRAFT_1464831 [Trichoderma longibrachiatum ATCC 18648]
MPIETEDIAAILALLLEVLGWLLHIFFATGYTLLCKWLEHIRNHEFDQRPRKIDRRYCLMAIIFYAFAAASHLVYTLKMRGYTGVGVGFHVEDASADRSIQSVALRCLISASSRDRIMDEHALW